MRFHRWESVQEPSRRKSLSPRISRRKLPVSRKQHSNGISTFVRPQSRHPYHQAGLREVSVRAQLAHSAKQTPSPEQAVNAAPLVRSPVPAQVTPSPFQTIYKTHPTHLRKARKSHRQATSGYITRTHRKGRGSRDHRLPFERGISLRGKGPKQPSGIPL